MNGSKSVRVDDDSYAVLVALAAVEDRPIVRVLKAAIAGYVPAKIEPSPAPVVETPIRPRGGPPPPGPTAHAMTVERVLACPHPKGAERNLSWGTVCGQCGTVLR